MSHDFCWISNFIGSARILAKNRDDFQKAGHSHHTYFCHSPLQKKIRMARETTLWVSRLAAAKTFAIVAPSRLIISVGTLCQIKNENVKPTRKMSARVGKWESNQGLLINALTFLPALEETDTNNKPMQRIKCLLGIKGALLLSAQKSHSYQQIAMSNCYNEPFHWILILQMVPPSLSK